MGLAQAFRLAWGNIIGNKLRSFLTMLGMIIGVASVIALVSLMQGMTDYMMKNFEDMGTNLITVNVRNTDSRKVDTEDMYRLVDDNLHIFDGMSPSVSGTFTVKNGTKKMENTSVTGVSEDYYTLNRLKLSLGRFLQYSDIKSRYPSCVIGTYNVKKLFDIDDPVGQIIKINGEPYTIVGILEEKANSQQNSTDDCIYIPYTNAIKIMKNANISSYSFAAKDAEVVEQGRSIIETYLYSVFRDTDLYFTMSMAQMLEMVDEMMNTMSTLLGGIAGISLLVAGIGIMNIMLVTVTERTREIGIRKSLGAKKRDIMRQFVMESGVTSTIGGGIGILIGGVGTTQIGKLVGLEAAPSISAIGLAFGVSLSIGIIFGYLPASKAAKLNPIDALRND